MNAPTVMVPDDWADLRARLGNTLILFQQHANGFEIQVHDFTGGGEPLRYATVVPYDVVETLSKVIAKGGMAVYRIENIDGLKTLWTQAARSGSVQ